jgi:hypothetical protein
MEINLQGSVFAKSRVEQIDEDYIAKYFKIIFEEGDLKEFGLFQDQLVPRQIFLQEEIDKKFIDRLHYWNKTGYNIYCSPAPRIKIPEKGEKSGILNVKLCRWFFADFDRDKMPWSDIPKKQLLNAIKFKLQQFHFPDANIIISTGHGYHLYWKIAEPLTREEWQPIENRLVYTLGADWKTRESNKVLRVPGFKNTKSKPFIKCRFEEASRENAYTLEEITRNLKKEIPDGHSNKKVNVDDFSKDRPTWIEDELKRLNLVNQKEPKISASGEVLVRAADPEHAYSYRTDMNIYTGRWFDHGHSQHPELAHKEFEGGSAVKYFTLIRHKKYTLSARGETKDDLVERYTQRFLDWLAKIVEIYAKDKEIYSTEYPEKTALKILKKYFVVPEGKPEAGMLAFYYFDGSFYYGHNGRYIKAKRDYLNSLIWYELKDSLTPSKKKDAAPIPFPTNQRIVDNIIKAIIGLRDLRYIIVKNGSYKRDKEIGNVFWINNRPDLPAAEDLMVVQNMIIDYRTLKTYDLTLNLFCVSPLNVNYDESLPQPDRCIQFLEDNFENEDQINEILKRDAYLCLPSYLEGRPAFFIMKGKTGSGKGTNIDFLREILGRSNYEESSLYALGEKYGLEKLVGILVAFISDLEDDSLHKAEKGLAMERIKRMSSGIDYVDVRLVGGKWITIKLPTKLVFATTILPTFPKSVSEFVRRLQITVYKKQYSMDKVRYPNALDPDDNCLEDMKKEKDAYFTHYIIKKGLKMLLEDGFKQTKEYTDNVQEIIEDSNPYEDFVYECTADGAGERIMNDTLLAVCKRWGEVTGRLKKWEIEELTFARITKQIRRDVSIETAKDKITKKTYVIGKKLTDYAKSLLNEPICTTPEM